MNRLSKKGLKLEWQFKTTVKVRSHSVAVGAFFFLLQQAKSVHMVWLWKPLLYDAAAAAHRMGSKPILCGTTTAATATAAQCE